MSYAACASTTYWFAWVKVPTGAGWLLPMPLFDLFQVAGDVREEGRMGAKSVKMVSRERIGWCETIIQQKRKPGGLEGGATPALVVKQTELAEKADVGERHILANQEAPPRAKRLLDAGEIGFEAHPGPPMQFRCDGAAQREKIVLSIACEDEARIEKPIDARSLIGVSAVKRKA